MKTRVDILRNVYGAALTVLGVLWITSVPQYLQITVVTAEVIGVMLGLAVAAAFLRHPYRAKTGLLELALGAVAVGCWLWMALHYIDGPWSSVALVTSTAVVAGWVLTRKGRLLPFVGALIVGSATLWVGAQSWWALAPSAVALSVPLWKRWRPSLNNDRD
ncbi:MAG: hypothetical protein E2P02_05810 [Acidobacteria bacterium]|nr:MAG: hypothetical protein E2P02_05810 [Acidobacteriota bacterium]